MDGSLASGNSHNAWISAYQASLTCTYSNVVFGEDSSWYIDVTAELRAWDRSDFNPGASFGVGNKTYYDNDFIWLLENTVWGADFDISATRTVSWRINE